MKKFGFHFIFDDSGGVVLVEAGGRPRDRGGSEGVDRVKFDMEMVDKRLGFGIFTFIREATRPG